MSSKSLRSREVLRDAQISIQLCEHSQTTLEFRIYWIASLAFLRSVGHVLQKVDGKRPEFGTAIANAWKRWKTDSSKNEIFWEFIEAERNAALKEYELSFWTDEKGPAIVVPGLPETYHLPLDIYRPIKGGPFEGNDARDILMLALEWWDDELKSIEIACGLDPQKLCPIDPNGFGRVTHAETCGCIRKSA